MLSETQIDTIRTSLESSTKYADSDYIEEVNEILHVFRNFKKG